MSGSDNRQPWSEGPDTGAAREDWLSFDDDEILYRLETLGPETLSDACLLEVVRSSRHFFVRQEAAKRVRDRESLFDFENDRHIGQILVRQLNRREDLAYLGRLVARSRYCEVRNAAQVQLRRLRERLGVAPAHRSVGDGAEAWRIVLVLDDPEARGLVARALPEPEFEIRHLDSGGGIEGLAALDPHLVITDTAQLAGSNIAETLRDLIAYVPLLVFSQECAGEVADKGQHRVADELVGFPIDPALLAAKTRALLYFAHEGIGTGAEPAAASAGSPSPPSTQAGRTDGHAETVDAMLLAWAVHFIVEPAWVHLGTEDASQLLSETRAGLMEEHLSLARFVVDSNARVTASLPPGTLSQAGSVQAVAVWMAAFLKAARRRVVEVEQIDVRQATRLMADALEAAGFYDAYDAASATG